MTRLNRRTGWLLSLACAATLSCTDSPVAPAAPEDVTGLDRMVLNHAATRGGSQGGISSATSNGNGPSTSRGLGALGRTSGSNGNGNNGGSSASTSDGCGAASASAASADSLPGDLCVIAQYRVDAPNPGRQMVSAFIGPEGGSLRLGDFEIVVPAGAVDRETRFAILLPPPGHGDRAYAEFRPHNQDFAVPVTIRLPYAITDAAPGAPITWWSQNGRSWIDQSTTPTTDGRIEAQVGHFSFYGTLRSGITIAGG